MLKRFTSLFSAVILILSLCFFVPTEVSAETGMNSDATSKCLSTVYKANLMEPAVINADGTITAKFNILKYSDNNDAKALLKTLFTYLPTDSQPDLKVSYTLKEETDENNVTYYNLSKSTFTITGKLNSAISSGTTLGNLNIADHDTIESIALNLETKESIKYDYSYSQDTLKKAYLYWDSANGSTLDALLNKEVLFNPEPEFFGKNSLSHTWDKHYMCNNNTLFDTSGREFSPECHNNHLELYYTVDFANSDTNSLSGIASAAQAKMSFDPSNPNVMHTKYPTDYIVRDLSKAPLIIPNEKGESFPLLQIDEESTETIKHEPASIHNNPADKKIKYQWDLKGDDGSSLSTETDQPSLSFASVSGMKSNVVYTITCNAVLTDLSGTAIDELSYADTHMVQATFDTQPAPTVEPENPADTSSSDVSVTASNKPAAVPKTGDTAPLGWLLITMILMSAVLIYEYVFHYKKQKNK